MLDANEICSPSDPIGVATKKMHDGSFSQLPVERLDMQAGDRLEDGAAGGIEMAEVDEVVGQGSGLVAGPGGERRKQPPLVDQAVLEG